MADHKDDDSSNDKNPPPKRVVVTYGGEKKKTTDVPPEIQPRSPKEVVSSPVDTGSGITLKVTEGESKSIKSQLHPKVPDEIAPRQPQAPVAAPVAAQVAAPVPAQAKPTVEPSLSAPTMSAPPPSSTPPVYASARSAGASSTYASAPPPPPPQPPPSGYESARGGINAGSIALFLSLLSSIAIIALIFYAYLSHQELDSLKAQTHDEKTSVVALVGQAKSSLEQLDTMRLQHQKSQETLQQLQGELENTSQKIVALSHNREWVLSEVSYLLFMANQRLHIAQDVPTALMLLQSADQRLLTLGDPSLLTLKQAIQKDIAKLLTYPIVDLPQLWQEIGKINDLINQLHFKTLNDYLDKKQAQALVSANDPAWLRALHTTWKEFKDLVRITKEEENTIPAALSLQEKAQVARTLELLVNEAQWAALNREGQIYLNTLQSIAAKVQEYFTDNAEQQVLLNALTQLAQAQVNFNMPELTDLLTVLSTVNKSVPLPLASPQKVTQ